MATIIEMTEDIITYNGDGGYNVDKYSKRKEKKHIL